MIGTITASRLNIRAQPSQQGRKLGEYSLGTLIDITGERLGWFEVLYQGQPAFLHADYVDLVEQPSRLIGRVTANLLNVRQQPDSNSAILGTLTAGNRVELLAQLEGWLEVEFNQGNAYVAREYVDLHPREAPQQGVVDANLLHVRSQASRQASSLGQLAAGSRMVIESRLGDWFEIPFGSSRGYVAATYIRTLQEAELLSGPIDENEEEEEDSSLAPAQPADEASRLPPLQRLPISGSSQARKVATTWNRYGGLLSRLSDEKQLDVACAVAVLCVESSGKGFEESNQGRMIIRFENHKLWKFWGRQHADDFHNHFRYKTSQTWKGHQWRATQGEEWHKFHGSQRAEWEVLEFARSIDNEAALKSISMGAPQIMGFHHEQIGYPSAEAMFDAFSNDIEAQIRGFFDFFSRTMVQRLQRQDFSSFAGLYNGSGQKQKYGSWIKQHYDALKQIAPR